MQYDQEIILERFIFEKENLEEQLVPRSQWQRWSDTHYNPDMARAKVKHGDAIKTKHEPTKLDPSLGSSPNLPAVIPRKFIEPKKSLWYKSKTAKIVAAGILSAAIIALAYKVYKKYNTDQDCKNMKSGAKEVCLKRNKVRALKKEIEVLYQMQVKCSSSNNYKQCADKIDKKIESLKSQIKKAA